MMRAVSTSGTGAVVTGATVRSSGTTVDATADITAVSAPPLPFEQFYRSDHERIAKALAVTLRDGELAADATNEAMTRAYQRWSKISAYRDPAGWVYRVGLNWAISWQRRRRRERERPVVLHPATTELSLRDDRFDAAMATLSVDHRAVVACRIYLDWSVERTAEALDIKPGTVKSRLARAIAIIEGRLPGKTEAP